MVDADGRALDPQPESVKEGETIKVELTSVDENGDALAFREKFSISLTSTGTADAADYALSMRPVEIAADGKSATVDLTVRENEEVNPETLVLDAEVAGERDYGRETRTSAGILSLAIEDTTPRLVEAQSEEELHAALTAAKAAAMGDHGLNPGEDFELMGADLFDVATGVTVSYSADSDDRSVTQVSVGGGAISVMPTAAGTAQVTVTATATAAASGVEIIEQTQANVARIRFPVEVTPAPPTFTLSAADTNIVEGMAARLTVSPSRAVSTDTEVTIMRDGASSAGDDDYECHPMTVTIGAGRTSGHTMVTAVEDETAEEAEVLTLFAVVDGVTDARRLRELPPLGRRAPGPAVRGAAGACRVPRGGRLSALPAGAARKLTAPAGTGRVPTPIPIAATPAERRLPCRASAVTVRGRAGGERRQRRSASVGARHTTAGSGRLR